MQNPWRLCILLLAASIATISAVGAPTLASEELDVSPGALLRELPEPPDPLSRRLDLEDSNLGRRRRAVRLLLPACASHGERVASVLRVQLYRGADPHRNHRELIPVVECVHEHVAEDLLDHADRDITDYTTLIAWSRHPVIGGALATLAESKLATVPEPWMAADLRCALAVREPNATRIAHVLQALHSEDEQSRIAVLGWLSHLPETLWVVPLLKALPAMQGKWFLDEALQRLLRVRLPNHPSVANLRALVANQDRLRTGETAARLLAGGPLEHQLWVLTLRESDNEALVENTEWAFVQVPMADMNRLARHVLEREGVSLPSTFFEAIGSPSERIPNRLLRKILSRLASTSMVSPRRADILVGLLSHVCLPGEREANAEGWTNLKLLDAWDKAEVLWSANFSGLSGAQAKDLLRWADGDHDELSAAALRALAHWPRQASSLDDLGRRLTKRLTHANLKIRLEAALAMARLDVLSDPLIPVWAAPIQEGMRALSVTQKAVALQALRAASSHADAIRTALRLPSGVPPGWPTHTDVMRALAGKPGKSVGELCAEYLDAAYHVPARTSSSSGSLRRRLRARGAEVLPYLPVLRRVEALCRSETEAAPLRELIAFIEALK